MPAAVRDLEAGGPFAVQPCSVSQRPQLGRIVLKAHIDSSEAALLAISRIPANAGHSLHKGTPREAFVREFLQSHLAETIAIGSGEIIDHESRPGASRNQVDLVLFKRNFPRLHLGGGLHGFLVESVVATIEVKSTLDAAEMKRSIGAARNIKALKPHLVRSFHTGHQPPGILSYLVAYDGPVHMETVHGWLAGIHADLGISVPSMPGTLDERVKIASPSIDGVFVLGKGFLCFDNSPIGFVTDPLRGARPECNWFFADTTVGSLLLLFLMLTMATSGTSAAWLDPFPYLSHFTVTDLKIAP